MHKLEQKSQLKRGQIRQEKGLPWIKVYLEATWKSWTE